MTRSTTSTKELTLRRETASTRLSSTLGYRFDTPALFDQALSHRSWCSENGNAQSNERLEFLGDAILGMVIADYLYQRYPDLPEGKLAPIRSAVVSSSALAEIARSIDLGQALKLGKGEAAMGGAKKQSILADALEAILGAIYLDSDLKAVSRVILALWVPHIESAVAGGFDVRDFKSRFQELAVSLTQMHPTYQVLAEGPDHQQTFHAEAILGTEVVGRGVGSTKKDAEQSAAEEAYKNMAATTKAT